MLNESLLGVLHDLFLKIGKTRRYGFEKVGSEQSAAYVVFANLPKQVGDVDSIEQQRPEEQVLLGVWYIDLAKVGFH